MNPKPTYEELEARVKALEEALDRARRKAHVLEREDRYRQLFELESDALFLIDSTDGRILEANQAASDLYGYTREELLALRNTDLSAEPDSTRRATQEGHRVVPVRYHRNKDGSILPVEITASHFEWQGRKVHIAAIREIGWRLQAEEDLRQSEKRLRNVLETVEMIAVSLDARGNITFCNDFLLAITGWEREQVLGKSWFETFLPAESRAEVERSFVQAFASGQCPAHLQNEIIRRNGERRLVNWSNTVYRNAQGDVIAVTSMGEDVTDRMRTEMALRESESKMRSIFRAAPVGIGLVADRTLLEVNEKLCSMTGFSKEELVGKNARVLYPSDEDYACVGIEKHRQIGTSGTGTVETKFKRKNGEIIDVLMSSTPLDPNDLSLGITFTALDITANKRSDDALRASHERFLTVLDSIDATIYVADRQSFEVLFMNKHMIESFGRDMTGETCWKAFRGESGPCPQCTNDQLVDEEGKPTGVHVWQGRNPVTGRWYINYDRAIEWTDGRLVRLQIATDVSDQVRMEEELRQAQKMEAVGTLAGGIAHNFNNTLMGIQGRASLMMMDKSPSHPDYAHLKGIEEYVRSAAELTKDLLGFAKGGKYEVKTTDLNALIRNETRMFGQTKKEIRIREKLAGDLWTVEVDQGQIRQALLNLFVNAWQAMPGGGDLYVQTGNVTLDQEDVNSPEIAPGRFVRILVTDTGVGMDARTVKKIFDPFFSTRAMGKGTGLGLASVYGIVKNHGGFINVQSEKGKGATFTLYLPASDREVVEEEKPDAQVVMGEGGLLLVDDEQMILEVGGQLLERLGYRVFTAGSGPEALELYAARKGEIDLVVLDMIMPGMSGGETYDCMREIDPEVRVLLSSGYTLDGQAQEILDRGCQGFIQKPFDLKALSRKIRQALDI